MRLGVTQNRFHFCMNSLGRNSYTFFSVMVLTIRIPKLAQICKELLRFGSPASIFVELFSVVCGSGQKSFFRVFHLVQICALRFLSITEQGFGRFWNSTFNFFVAVCECSNHVVTGSLCSGCWFGCLLPQTGLIWVSNLFEFATLVFVLAMTF